MYAKNSIVVGVRGADPKMLTSIFWFSHRKHQVTRKNVTRKKHDFLVTFFLGLPEGSATGNKRSKGGRAKHKTVCL